MVQTCTVLIRMDRRTSGKIRRTESLSGRTNRQADNVWTIRSEQLHGQILNECRQKD